MEVDGVSAVVNIACSVGMSVSFDKSDGVIFVELVDVIIPVLFVNSASDGDVTDGSVSMDTVSMDIVIVSIPGSGVDPGGDIMPVASVVVSESIGMGAVE